MIKRIEDEYDVKPGELYNVPCLITEFYDDRWIDWDLLDLDHKPPVKIDKIFYTPVIDFPHHDKENGQPLAHYHADDRFVGEQPHLSSLYTLLHILRIYRRTEKLVRLDLFAQNKYVLTRTSNDLIRKSIIKNRCIKNGKCPHRGYDLTNVPVSPDGTITCPLHNLKFEPDTKKLLDF